MAKASRLTSIKCTVCRHPERVRIEMARLSGASLESIAAKFNLKKDAIARHMVNHVDADRRALLVADVPLKELADKAAAEGTSVLENLSIVRSTVMTQMISASSVNDRHATAALAGKATEVLREIGKITGEILRSAPVGNITNNTMVLMASPQFASLERMLLERLAPHPQALQAVLEGLRDLDAEPADMPAFPAMRTIEHADARPA